MNVTDGRSEKTLRLILASASPRRKEILQNLGLSFEVTVADVDESCDERDPTKLVEILSQRKAEAVRALLLARGEDLENTVILASATSGEKISNAVFWGGFGRKRGTAGVPELPVPSSPPV